MSQSSDWTRLWAKSAESGPGHSLLAHMIDVGLVAQHILSDARHSRLLAATAGRLTISEEAWRRIAVILVALHDIGKSIPPFQAKWPEGAPQAALDHKSIDMPHGQASAIILYSWLRLDKGWKPLPAEALANAVGMHHGQLIQPNFFKSDKFDGRSVCLDRAPWLSWRKALFKQVEAVFGDLPTEVTTKVPAVDWAWLAGLTSVADWIGSSLPHKQLDHDEIHSYVESRTTEVSSRLQEINWPLDGQWWLVPEAGDTFESWFSFAPRELQRTMDYVLKEGEAEPALHILEAPTGEGKTEAALLATTRFSGSRGFYIGMPTQATSNALHGRVKEFVDRHKGRPVDVALAHSGARLNILQRSRPVSHDKTGLDSESDAVSWFAAGRRELLAEIGVGTIDQPLLAVLPVKHHTVRLWALSGKTVILDEVHAYDAYTRTLLESLITWLAALDCRIVVLSATLPAASRQSMADAFMRGIGKESGALETASYPRLTSVAAGRAQVIPFKPDEKRAKTVSIEPAPFDVTELGQTIAALTRGGGALGVIVNTVRRAQDLYSWCAANGIEAMLLHAAYPAAVRQVKEEQIMARYGPESTGERGGVVIATQVLEQSLDLDFDALITDLAPVDLIMQRVGRLHRHARTERGGHGQPVVHIAGLLDGTDRRPESSALQSIYEEHVMWRSWAVLTRTATLQLPEDTDRMVQAVYSGEELPELEAFAEEVSEAERVDMMRRNSHEASAKNWLTAEPWEPARDAWRFTGTDDEERKPGFVRIPTRLGDMAVGVIPVVEENGNWHLINAMESFRPHRNPGQEWVTKAIGQQLRVSNKALASKLLESEAPRWWQQNPALRHIRPMLLNEQHELLVDRRARMDPELGLRLPAPRGQERSHP